MHNHWLACKDVSNYSKLFISFNLILCITNLFSATLNVCSMHFLSLQINYISFHKFKYLAKVQYVVFNVMLIDRKWNCCFFWLYCTNAGIKQYNNSIFRHGNSYLTSKTVSEKKVLFIFIVIEDNKSNAYSKKVFLQSNLEENFPL